MDVGSGNNFNVQSETGLPMRMLGRIAAFDALRYGSLLKPGGEMDKCDYLDILQQDFSDVTTPVFFGNTYAKRAGYPNQQKFRLALTACKSQWYIPQAEVTLGCSYEPVYYMEASSAYAPAGPLTVRDFTGGSTLIRDVRISREHGSGSTLTVCGSGSAKLG